MATSEKLPIQIGFILRDGSVLQKIRSHRNTATIYLKELGKEVAFLQSDISSEDDFLVKRLGAIKLYVSSGKKYLYCNNSTYREMYRIIKAYIEEGYVLIRANFESAYDTGESRPNFSGIYNRQVVYNERTGKYEYNPKRIGD